MKEYTTFHKLKDVILKNNFIVYFAIWYCLIYRDFVEIHFSYISIEESFSTQGVCGNYSKITMSMVHL